MTSRPVAGPAQFATEADLCAAFISQLPAGWTAYPESGGFDILLSRNADGAQVGIEAKLTLNAKVIEQIVPTNYSFWEGRSVDFRAVLVPWGRAGGLSRICFLLGITVLQMKSRVLYQAEREYEIANYGRVYHPISKFKPELPESKEEAWYYWRSDWHDWCPERRIELPEYIPDVRAGASAPVQLSMWKISAIKLCIVLDRRGYVTASDFKHFKISPSRWTQHFLERGAVRGQYIRGRYTPDYRPVHPVNFEQIEADFEKWAPEDFKK